MKECTRSRVEDLRDRESDGDREHSKRERQVLVDGPHRSLRETHEPPPWKNKRSSD